MTIWFDEQGRRHWRYNELAAGYGQDFEWGFGDDYGRGHFDRPSYQGRPYGKVSWRGYTYPRESYYGPGQAWQAPGPYSGRGPRGYRRSDERIHEEVAERLAQHGQIDASDIDVSVDNGEVTLEGTVDSRWVKRLAEDVADSVTGVTDVHNRLRVSESGESRWAQGMSRESRLIRSGMNVVGTDGERIGQVKEVRGSDFLIDRPMARDVYVPFSACRTVSSNRVVLTIRADEVDNMGWANPELTEVPAY